MMWSQQLKERRKHAEHLVEKGLGRVRFVLGRGTLARLERVAPELAGGLREALRSRYAPDERAVVRRIEALRGRLMGDVTPLALVDFGAGKPDAALSAEQMATGTQRTRTVAEMTGASKSPFWAGVLFRLVRTFRPAKALELGTCLGLSAAYQASAQTFNGGGGQVVTLEGAPALASIARTHLAELGIANVEIVLGRFADTLPEVLARGPYGYVFIDGHHDEAATLAYFDQVRPFMTPDGIIVFDDIDYSAGMGRAWKALAVHPAVAVAVDLGRLGVVRLGVREGREAAAHPREGRDPREGREAAAHAGAGEVFRMRVR